MTIFIIAKKYIQDNPLNYFLIGQLLYNKDKKCIGAYSFTGPNKMIYTTNMSIVAPEDVYFKLENLSTDEIKKLDDWAKSKNYKFNIEIT